MGSWPALSEVAQKARKEAEKENKPLRGDAAGGGGGGEGEGGKVTGKEKKGGSVGGGGERGVSGGGGTMGGGGGGAGGGVMEKTSEGDANGDSQRFSGRRKGIFLQSEHVQIFGVLTVVSLHSYTGSGKHKWVPLSIDPPPSSRPPPTRGHPRDRDRYRDGERYVMPNPLESMSQVCE